MRFGVTALGLILIAVLQFVVVLLYLTCNSGAQAPPSCPPSSGASHALASSEVDALKRKSAWASAELVALGGFSGQVCARPEEREELVSLDSLYCLEAESSRDSYSWIDWKTLEDSVLSSGYMDTRVVSAWQALVAPYLALEAHPVTQTRRLKPLEVDCNVESMRHLLTGRKRERPVRVIDFFVLGHQLSELEVRLFELQGVAETVLLESTLSDRVLPKTLFFSRWRQRFSLFTSNITHLVEDGRRFMEREGSMRGRVMDIHGNNRGQLLDAFRHLNVSKDDLWLFGEVEEVPRGDVINHLKHCELKPLSTPLQLGMSHHVGSFLFDQRPSEYVGTIVGQFGDNSPRDSAFSIRQTLSGAGWYMEQFGGVLATLYSRLNTPDEPWSAGKGFAFYRDPWGVTRNFLHASDLHADAEPQRAPSEKHARKTMRLAAIQSLEMPWAVEANPKHFMVMRSKRLMMSARDWCLDEGAVPEDYFGSRRDADFKLRLKKYFQQRKGKPHK